MRQYIAVGILLLSTAVFAQFDGGFDEGKKYKGSPSDIADSLAIVHDSLACLRDTTQQLNADLSYARGLSLDLEYYWARNVYPITGTTVTAAQWASTGGTTVSDNEAQYLTDNFAVKLSDAPDLYDGMSLPATSFFLSDTNLTHWQDQDTITDDNSYVCFAVYFPAESLDSLGTASIRFAFNENTTPGGSNLYKYDVAKETWAAGWNFLKIARSAFTATGSPSWNNVGCFYISIIADPPGAVSFTVDNIRLERKAAGGNCPNAFQRKIAETWVDEWTDGERNREATIVKEGNRLGLLFEYIADTYLKCNIPLRNGTITVYRESPPNLNYVIWGAVKRGAAHTFGVGVGTGYNPVELVLYGPTLSTPAARSGPIPFNILSQNLHWSLEQRDSTWVGSLTNGTTTVSVSTTVSGSEDFIYPELICNQSMERIMSAGFSTVEYAERAGVAQQVEFIWVRNDTLFFRPAGLNSDSTAYVTPSGKKLF